MKTRSLVLVAIGVAFAAFAIGRVYGTSASERSSTIAKQSEAYFLQAARVIESPRCMNCHPRDDRPRQGDQSSVHFLNVVRGSEGSGVPAMKCAACHGEVNNPASGAPGAPNWTLAPISMAWVGLSPRQICEQLKDPTRNGRRDLRAIVEHVASDPLVGWGWHPGSGRKPAPSTQAETGHLFAAWVDTGAVCPGESDGTK